MTRVVALNTSLMASHKYIPPAPSPTLNQKLLCEPLTDLPELGLIRMTKTPVKRANQSEKKRDKRKYVNCFSLLLLARQQGNILTTPYSESNIRGL